MKYPQNQLEVLQTAINELSKNFEVKNMNPSTLHYIVFQQASEGQKHDWLFTNGTEIKRSYQLTDTEGYTKLLPITENFELYPNNCNDSHIETAVKYCIKNLS